METELYTEMAEMEKTHWWFLGRQAVLRDVIARFGKSGGRLLDIGAGTCLNTAAFAKLGFKAEALESHPDALALAKVVAPDVHIVEAPFPSPLVASDAYDVLTMLDVLEHIEDDRSALHEVARSLSHGGIVLVTVPAFMFLWTSHDELAHHYRRYRRGELIKKFSEAGLEPVLVSYYNFFLFPAIAGVRVMQKIVGRSREKSDFSRTPKILNGALSMLFGAERFLLRYMRLPFGVSLIAVARKK
jgi:SAM-dependent methyltransferase